MWVGIKCYLLSLILCSGFPDFIIVTVTVLSFVVSRDIHSENLIAYYAKFIINIKCLLLLWKCLLDIHYLQAKLFKKMDVILIPFVGFESCKGKMALIIHSCLTAQYTTDSRMYLKSNSHKTKM